MAKYSVIVGSRFVIHYCKKPITKVSHTCMATGQSNVFFFLPKPWNPGFSCLPGTDKIRLLWKTDSDLVAEVDFNALNVENQAGQHNGCSYFLQTTNEACEETNFSPVESTMCLERR